MKQLRYARGGGNKETVIAAKRDQILSDPSNTFSVEEVGAFPLPTSRPRAVMYVSGNGSRSAEALRAELEELKNRVAAVSLMHHAAGILGDYIQIRCAGPPGGAGGAVGQAGGACAAAKAESAYHKFFAAAMQKAIEKKRIPAAVTLPLRQERTSATQKALYYEPPWIQAQADVYTLIAQELLVQQPVDDPFVLFDVSQRCDRGSVTVDGAVPTATTSSLWYCPTLKGFVSPEGMLACHGMDPSQFNLAGLEASEKIDLVGNMMATTALAVSLTPLLHALGFLERGDQALPAGGAEAGRVRAGGGAAA